MGEKERIVAIYLVALMLVSLLLSSCGAGTIEASEPTKAPWPMKRGDARNSGVSDFSVSTTTPEELWRVESLRNFSVDPRTPFSKPVIGPNGWVIITDYDGNVSAIDQKGVMRWSQHFPEMMGFGTAAISPDGTIYVPATNGTILSPTQGTIYALNSNGQVKWRAKLDQSWSSISSVTIDSRGNVYSSAGVRDMTDINEQRWINTTFFALDPAGNLLWHFETKHGWANTPAISPDGSIILISGNDLYSLSDDGHPKWRYQLPSSDTFSETIVTDDGSIVFVCNNTLFSISADGLLRWKVENATSSWRNAPLLYQDHTIILVDYQIIAFDEEGRILWNGWMHWFPPMDCPILTNNGLIIGNYQQRIFAINMTGSLIWEVDIGINMFIPFMQSPIVGYDGRIFIYSVDEFTMSMSLLALGINEPTVGTEDYLLVISIAILVIAGVVGTLLIIKKK